MNDLIIKVSKLDRAVLPEKSFIGNDGENLQCNLVFIFTDSFVDGEGRLEYQIGEDKYYAPMEKIENGYSIPIKNVVTKEGNITFQLVVTEAETEEGIPLFKSDIFNLYCKESVNGVEEAPEGYELWIDIANEKIREINEAIAEVDNLDIEVETYGGITYIILTDKEGNTKRVAVNNGTGIVKIEKTHTVDLVDTYTIYYSDGTTSTFEVTNGNYPINIEKTGTSGLVDTYTITYGNSQTATFTVTNGQDGEVSQEELDRVAMIYNVLPRVTETGTTLSLDDTAECPLDITLKGNSYQFTTTGKNLVNFTNNQMPLIDNITLLDFGEDKTLTNVTMTLFLTNVIYTNSSGSIVNYQKNDGTNQYRTMSNFGASSNTTLNGAYSKSEETITFRKLIITKYPTFTQGTMYIQLENGNSTSYEPYTGGIPAPNPDYPENIQVVTGENEITVCGKNLFDKNSVTSSYLINRDNGQLQYNSSYSASDYIAVISNKKYTFSNINRWYSAYYDENKNYVGYPTNTSTITIPNGVKFIRLSCENTNINNAQFEQNENATSYESYQSQTYPINLGKNLYKNDNTTYSDSNCQVVTLSTGNRVVLTQAGSPAFGCVKLGEGELLGKTVTFSAQIQADYQNAGRIELVFKKSDGYTWSVISGSAMYNTGGHVTFTIPSSFPSGYDSIWIRMFTNLNSTASIGARLDYVNVQVELGTTKTDYADYFTPIELCKIGNYQDVIFKNTTDSEYYDSSLTLNAWYVKKAIGKVILDGSEDWGTEATTYYLSNFGGKPYSSFSANTPYALSNRFIWQNGTSGSFVAGSFWYTLNGNVLRMQKDNPLDLAGFKAWLSIHNTTTYYVLETPTYTRITSYQLYNQLNNLEKAISYDTQTNITQTNADYSFIITATGIHTLANIFNGGN